MTRLVVPILLLYALKIPPAALDRYLELTRRQPPSLAANAASAERLARAEAAAIRAWYYPKQGAFYVSTPESAKWRATSKTRRSGATAGGCREFLARAIAEPGFRATYVTTSRKEAEQRAWCNDTKSGLVDVIRQRGDQQKHPTLEAWTLGGVLIEIRAGDLVLEFGNGSQIELFGADNVRRHRVKRGNAKHVFWIDEAQDFPFLDEFFDAVVIGSLTDFQGECWMTGTPGRDCAGMFYEVTKEPSEGDERLPGWDVHTIAVVDNPYFGLVVTDATGDCEVYHVEAQDGQRQGPYDDAETAERAAVEVRWDRTAGAALKAKGWKGDEPDFVREWLGRWVKEDARFVYPVHAVPTHQLLYAEPRFARNPLIGTHPRFDGHPAWYDHTAAFRDLPRPLIRARAPYQWLFAIGVDFGYHPDPFALVVWAFTPELPDIYEMFSWKHTKVNTDDQGAYMRMLWDALPNVVSFVGDPAGKQDDFEVWRTRMGLPIEEANKKGKNTLEEFLADDIRRGRVHLRKNSPLHTEMKHLVYLPGKPGKTREVHKHRKVGGVIHGDHCADSARYSYVDLTHWLSKLREDKPAPGSRAALEAEATKLEANMDALDARGQQLAELDEQVREYGAYDAWG